MEIELKRIMNALDQEAQAMAAIGRAEYAILFRALRRVVRGVLEPEPPLAWPDQDVPAQPSHPVNTETHGRENTVGEG